MAFPPPNIVNMVCRFASGAPTAGVEAAKGQFYVNIDDWSLWLKVETADTAWELVGRDNPSALPEQWAQNAIPANQTDEALEAQVSTHFPTYVASHSGSLTGIAWRLTGSRTAGSITLTPTINGVATGLVVTISDASTSGADQQGAYVDTFNAGDTIGMLITTSADFEPDGDTVPIEDAIDVEVTLDVVFNYV